MHGISPEAIDVLTHYSWPGNVRELEAVIRQALLNTTGNVILPDFLPDHIRMIREPGTVAAITTSGSLPASDLCAFVDDCLRQSSEQMYATSIEMMERYLLTRVLRHAQGNQSQAARMLGITRGSLRNKMRSLGIQIGNTVNVDEFASAEPLD